MSEDNACQVGGRLRRRWRHALVDLLPSLVGAVGVILFDGPVGSPLGFAFFTVFLVFSYDLCMVALYDEWLLGRKN